MIDTVKVHYKAEGICEPIESSKETTDVSKVVENVVDNTLNEQAVLIKLIDNTARNAVFSVIYVC